MLEAVNTIHDERIVHSDLKPANFMLVRGSLKLIDFGIAKAIMNDTTNIQRDAQVPCHTLWHTVAIVPCFVQLYINSNIIIFSYLCCFLWHANCGFLTAMSR